MKTTTCFARPYAKVCALLAGLAVVAGLTFAHAASAKDAEAFQALIAAAKKEGTVTVDGPPIKEIREALVNGFQNKYGISVQYISSGTSKSGARVRAERAAGKYELDVFHSGADTPLHTFVPSGWCDPIKPVLLDPAVNDPSKWRDGHVWFMEPNGVILRLSQNVSAPLAINTKLVKPGEIDEWKDLLDPKWKGKIVAKDPSLSGSGASLTSYFYLKKGPEFVKALYKDQQPVISRNARQAVQWLAQGNYPVLVGPDSTELDNLMRRGYPVAIVDAKDGPGIMTGGWSTLCLLNRAPHPNAAKLYINWLASKEGQEIFSRASQQLSLRTDVSRDWAPDYVVPKKGREYLDTYEYNFVIKERDAAFQKVRELLH